LTNPNAKLMGFPKRTYTISKLKIATKVKKEPLTLKPFKNFLSFIIALIKRRTAIRLIILAKSKTILTESIFSNIGILCF